MSRALEPETHVTVPARQWHTECQLLLQEHIASSMTEHQGANVPSNLHERCSATSYTHHLLQGVSAEAARAIEPGTHNAVSGRSRHAGPQLLVGSQGARQGLHDSLVNPGLFAARCFVFTSCCPPAICMMRKACALGRHV